MAVGRILIFIAFVVLVSANEVEDVEQKKRGAAKTSSLNAIPTGAQKPEYTYSIYTQNPSTQSVPSPSYSQSQIPNSFYPSQSGSNNQYYSQANAADQSAYYPPQPQLNLIPPPSSSQFVPLNFIPSPGYQSKYQIVPSKSPNGNLQLAIIQQQPSLLQSPSFVPLYSPSNQINPQQPIQQQAQYSIGSNFQQFPFANPYVGHPSTMFLLAQPNPSLYNNYVLPNPNQQLYNYFQSNPQAKYNLLYGGTPQTNASPNTNEKYQAASSNQQISKEDNEIAIHNNEYITPAESNSNYKNSYTTGRGSSYTN